MALTHLSLSDFNAILVIPELNLVIDGCDISCQMALM